jgi:hypothetical protein
MAMQETFETAATNGPEYSPLFVIFGDRALTLGLESGDAGDEKAHAVALVNSATELVRAMRLSECWDDHGVPAESHKHAMIGVELLLGLAVELFRIDARQRPIGSAAVDTPDGAAGCAQ